MRTSLEDVACPTIAAMSGKLGLGAMTRERGVVNTNQRGVFLQIQRWHHMIAMWAFSIGKQSGRSARCPGVVSISPKDVPLKLQILPCSTAMRAIQIGKWHGHLKKSNGVVHVPPRAVQRARPRDNF